MCVPVCACIRTCEHQHLQCFPADLEGIKFAIGGAMFTFLRRYKREGLLLPGGLFLFRRVVSFLAASTARCCCETGALRGLQSPGAGVWF